MNESLLDQLAAANTALYQALESADVERMASVWDVVDDEALVCVHPGWPMLRGRRQILHSFSAIMANTPYIQFFLTDLHVSVDGDTAVVTCTENILTAVSQEGSSGQVVATNVFRRRPDGWRLQVHHGSPVMGTLEETDD